MKKLTTIALLLCGMTAFGQKKPIKYDTVFCLISEIKEDRPHIWCEYWHWGYELYPVRAMIYRNRDTITRHYLQLDKKTKYWIFTCYE